MNVHAAGGSRSDIYLQMPFQHLRFEKKANGFGASYTATIIVRNSKDEIVVTKETERTILVRTYDETVSPRFDLFFQSFLLPAGDYAAEISAMDGLSQLRFTQSVPFTADDHERTFRPSTILYLDGMQEGKDGVVLRPMLPASFSLLRDSLGTYQEFYNLRSGDSLHISDEYAVHRMTDEENTPPAPMAPPIVTPADRCGSNADSVYYRSDTTVAAFKNGITPVLRFHPVPADGGNEIRRTVTVLHDNVRDTFRYTQNIFRRDHRLRASLTLEELTQGLRYIMRSAEFDSISAVNGTERMQRIERFWERRGGKERQRDFERRMVEANRLFSTCVNGSQTAMGIVYMVCGAPDLIECRGAYAETWVYAVGDRAFSVQFRREEKSSQHFTLHPFSMNDHAWQYFIDRWRRYQ